MAPVSNITEFGNSVHVTDVVSRLMAPAFVKTNQTMNLIYTEELPVGTMTKLFGKKGSLTAAALVESTALAVDSNGELTDTSVSSTVAKVAVSSGLSIEGETFGSIDLNRISEEQGAAIGRYVDDDLIGLFSGLSVGVTSTTVMTVDDLMLGQYSIDSSKCPNPEVMLQAVLGARAVYNLRKEMIQSGASAWTNQTMLNVLMGQPQRNGYVGSIPGIADVYRNFGFGTTGGDDIQGIFHPMWCFAGQFAAGPSSWITRKGSEGIYTECVSWYFYDVFEWNDLAGVKLRSDT